MSRMKRSPLIDVACDQFSEYSRKELLSMIYCRELDLQGSRPHDPRLLVPEDQCMSIITKPFVSRGGEKLLHALETWDIDVSGLDMLDAGSSTGGFTHCLLQRGAARVTAVDVGYNQLDYTLRIDERVVVKERTNIMDLDPGQDRFDAAVADLSFRSIRGAASHILSMTRHSWLIALIKPQFELRDDPLFTGVVHDEAQRMQLIEEIVQDLADEGVAVSAMTASPITGRKGNMEYLALLVPVTAAGEGQ